MTAPGYRRGRCSVTGKAQYTTRRIAKRVAKSFGDNAKPFRCEACGFLHLGHLQGLTRAEHREYHGWLSGAAETIDPTGTPKAAARPSDLNAQTKESTL